ncbi:MAG: PASTA domain-containing protein [Acidimicrobiia bacterium]|nr:PASTA domain-containing protein [Acidimicrobiia bacterium]
MSSLANVIGKGSPQFLSFVRIGWPGYSKPAVERALQRRLGAQDARLGNNGEMDSPPESTTPSAVSVVSGRLGAAEPEPGPRPPRPRLGWAIVGVVAAGALLFLAGPQQPRVPEEEQPNGILLVVPDVVGLDVAAAEQLLGSAGFTRRTVRTWVSNELTPAGTVISQSPEQGLSVDAPVELLISTGGPTVSFQSLPTEAQDAATGANIAPDDTVLVLETAVGHAYLSAGVLFGQCAATELVSSEVARREERCITTDTSTVAGWLPDGTNFSVTGLPAGEYLPRAVAGVIMVDLPDGTSRPLGAHSHRRLRSDSVAAFESGTGVSWPVNGQLEIVGGAFAIDIDVDGRVMEMLGDDANLTILDSIDPVAVDEFLIVRLSPPLRWQRDGEVPGAISVGLGDIVVERVDVLRVRSDVSTVNVDDAIVETLVDPAGFAANPWVLAFELTFPDGGRWLLRLETRLSMDVVDVGMTGRLLVDGDWVADTYLDASPLWLESVWNPDGTLPQRIETHDRLDGALAETWWLTPDSCCAYVTFVAAPDGRVMQWASSALIEEREELVEAVSWAPDRVSFDSTRFVVSELTFSVRLETRETGHHATVLVSTPCSRGLVGQATCDRVEEVTFDANGLPFSEVRIRPLDR